MKDLVKIISELARFAEDLETAIKGKDCSGVEIAISSLRRRAYSLLDELKEIETNHKKER